MDNSKVPAILAENEGVLCLLILIRSQDVADNLFFFMTFKSVHVFTFWGGKFIWVYFSLVLNTMVKTESRHQ